MKYFVLKLPADWLYLREFARPVVEWDTFLLPFPPSLILATKCHFVRNNVYLAVVPAEIMLLKLGIH